MPYRFSPVAPEDVALLRALLAVFADAFDDAVAYAGAPPSDDYLVRTLSQPHVVVLVALDADDTVVGGLIAYRLDKLERARSEFYIYDLAVQEAHRRRGIATGLIRTLGAIAKQQGAWVMFVQADLTDPPAIALYQSLGVREDVLHFDLPLE